MFCLLAVNTAWYGALASRLNTLCGGAWWYEWNVPTTCGPAPCFGPDRCCVITACGTLH